MKCLCVYTMLLMTQLIGYYLKTVCNHIFKLFVDTQFYSFTMNFLFPLKLEIGVRGPKTKQHFRI